MFLLRSIRTVRLGLKSLLLHKMRSMLTVMGIIFGVCSVIAMLSISEGASREAQEQIKRLGTNNIIVRSVKPPEEQSAGAERQFVKTYGLTYKDAERMATTLPSVSVVVPVREISEDIWFGSRKAQGRVVGTVPWFPDISNFRPRRGRFLSYTDTQRLSTCCVLGDAIARELFTLEDPLGQRIKVRGYYFKVVGIMEERSAQRDRASAGARVDLNRNVYIALPTAIARFGELLIRRTSGSIQAERIQLHQINVKVAETEQVIGTSKAIEALLKRFHDEKDYELLVPLELLRQAERTRFIYGVVLGSIAAISLLVGGIGIMNIMLASITERTREIGIRRALGAKRRDIIMQFLVETVVLSVSGGVIGIVLGVVIPFAVTYAADMPTVITGMTICIAFGISVAVGIVFGMYPAWQAANMDPIEALRHE